jgi:uncharacterized protein
MHYLLFYEASPSYVEDRKPYRQEHLALAASAVERGELVLGGAYAEPADGGLLLFKGDSPDVARRFAEADPYVQSGIVKRWWVREWTTVVGPIAEAPVR